MNEPWEESPEFLAQRANALPLTAFYDDEGSDLSVPGKLIRSEVGTGYDLPAGATAVRIAYASRNVADEPVLATGVVLLPPGLPPAGGWPVIAWAHGTAGVARCCAPSLMKDIQYGWKGLFIYPLLGYAVVATDYAGLGSPGPHQLLWSLAQANDIAFAVPAARAAVPTLGADWVGVGHSQGGAAVLALAVLQHELDDPGYLGAISIAPPTDFDSMWRRLSPDRPSGGIALVALGILAGDPSFDIATMGGPEMLKRLPHLQADVALPAAFVLMEQAPRATLRAGWQDAEGVGRFVRANRPYERVARGPLLVLLGEADPAIPLDLTMNALEKGRRLGNDIVVRTYPDMDHEGVITASLADQLAWISARFRGRND